MILTGRPRRTTAIAWLIITIQLTMPFSLTYSPMVLAGEEKIEQSAVAVGEHFKTGALVITSDNSLANNTAVNAVEATVIDLNGNPVDNTPVTFSLSGSSNVASGFFLEALTDRRGVAKLAFMNKVAESVRVTATLKNTITASAETQFRSAETVKNIRSENLPQ